MRKAFWNRGDPSRQSLGFRCRPATFERAPPERDVRFSRLTNMALRPLGFELRRLPSREPPRASSASWTRPSRDNKTFKRSLHFQNLVELIEDVPGDIVECGVGAGRSLFLLGVLTDGGRHPRRVWGS